MFTPMTQVEATLLILTLAFALAAFSFAYLYFREKSRTARAEGALESRENLKTVFQSLAAETLHGNSEQFLTLAKTVLEKENLSSKAELEKKRLEIDKTVEPFQKVLVEYRQELEKIESERQKAYTRVESELKRVADISNNLNRETSALKNALKKPHIRGRWGEVQLKNCIELAGMSEFADVTFQDQHTDGDGSRLIPDLTVRMPGGRIVIVDAKTPIDAFLSSLEATDDETRAMELARHGKHVKEHVKKLATKGYSENLKDTADFTVMFLPNESFLYAALESEPDLVEFAIQKKILIATPPTFIGLLKVIRFGWHEEKLAENAQKISEVGMELHKRVCDFVDGFMVIGKSLEKAKAEFDAGLGRLESRVLPQAKKLETLGAKSVKSLPENINQIEGN